MSCGSKHTTVVRVPAVNTAPAIRQGLLAEFPDVVRSIREPIKVQAYKVGTTERCIEQLRAGIGRLPSWATGLALEAHYPEVAALACRYRHRGAPDVLGTARKYPDMRWYVCKYEEARSGDNGEDPIKVLHEIETVLTRLGRMA